MPSQVTVNLLDVKAGDDTPPLSDIIQEYGALPLDQRWRGDIRLDNIDPDKLEGARVYYLDFAKRREIGPGKLTDSRAIGPIKLTQDEAFGEETAALYVPAKKWLLILHNQTGVGPNRMMGYFNALDSGAREYDYEANPKVDAAIMKKLHKMKGVVSVEVTASLDALNASQRETGISLAQAARPTGAQRITFQLLANEPYRKGRFLDGPMMKDFMRHLRNEGEGVTALKIKGPDPEIDDKDLMIDLIRHRIKRKYRESELEISDRRFTIESRWDLLARAYRQWHNTV